MCSVDFSRQSLRQKKHLSTNLFNGWELNIDNIKRQWRDMTDIISVSQLKRSGDVREGRMEKRSNQSESLCEGIDLSSRSLALPASGNDLHYTGCTPTGAEGWRDFTLEISPIKLQNWVIKWLGQKTTREFSAKIRVKIWRMRVALTVTSLYIS